MSAVPHIQRNIAGRLAAMAVQSRLVPVFILTLLLLGGVLYVVMPREENPQIVVPVIEIAVPLPGAAPEEVAQQLSRPLEALVKPITGVEQVVATALPSLAVLTVQFHAGADKVKALVAVQDRVMGHREALPPGAGAPQMRSIEVDDVPILTLTLASATYDDHALKRLADRLADGLRSLDGVSALTVHGGRDRELRVEIDPSRLRSAGVSLDQVRAALAAGNVAAPLGTVLRQGRQHAVELDAFIQDAEDLRRLIVGVPQGRPVALGDVAQVIDGPPEERDELARLGFGPGDARHADPAFAAELPAVTLAVAKQPGTNAVVVSRQVQERIERMRAQFVPAGVTLLVTRDDGGRAQAAVNKLFEHFAIAVAVVGVVCAVFLGWKEALIVVLTVPLVMVLTLGACHLAGLTINRVTLFGVILSLGLLVDAAIVVIENIHRRLGATAVAAHTAPGDQTTSALPALAVQATDEIGSPTNLATLAVMLVFGCMLTVSGMMGQYFEPVGFGVAAAMAASLVVAYTVVPWAAARWLAQGGHGTDQPQAPRPDRLQHAYRHQLHALLGSAARRRGLFLGVLLALGLSLLQPAWQFIRPSGPGGPVSSLGVLLSLLTGDNNNTFNITLDLPPGATAQDSDRLAREIGALLRTHPQVGHYQTWIGRAGVPDFAALAHGSSQRRGGHVAEIRVNLVDKTARDVTSIAIVRALRPEVMRLAARVPGTTVQVVENPAGPALRASLMAELYADDPVQLRELSTRVEAAFRSTYDVAEVVLSEPPDAVREQLVVDRDKAALAGVSVAQVGLALQRLMAGETLGQAHLPGEKNPVPIRLRVPARWQVDPAQLAGLDTVNAAGRTVPLAELVRLQPGPAPRPVIRKNGERLAFVGAELSGTPTLPALLDLDRRLDGLALANGQRLTTANLRLNPVAPDVIDGPRLLWDGETRMALSVYRDMLRALAAAVVGIFLLLVAYYRAFDLPLVAMAALPLGLIGVFPGHWLLGMDFSATSMVGLIALAGIVVRNSLLIIDFTLQQLQHGLPLREALVEACALRLRPIVLTALAVVLGSAIMLADPVFRGLAASLISGTLVSTVLSLLVLPALLLRVLRPRVAAAQGGTS